MGWWDSDTNLARGSKVLLFFAVICAFLGYLGYRMMGEGAPNPCSETGYPGRCYHVREHICDLVWQKAETECKGTIEKLNLPPGRLIGQILSRCQLIKIDEAFSVSRKSTPECDEKHDDLIDWKKRNGF